MSKTTIEEILQDFNVNDIDQHIITGQIKLLLEKGIPKLKQRKFKQDTPNVFIATCGSHNVCRDKMLRYIRKICFMKPLIYGEET